MDHYSRWEEEEQEAKNNSQIHSLQGNYHLSTKLIIYLQQIIAQQISSKEFKTGKIKFINGTGLSLPHGLHAKHKIKINKDKSNQFKYWPRFGVKVEFVIEAATEYFEKGKVQDFIDEKHTYLNKQNID